jgi:hypothetical protein
MLDALKKMAGGDSETDTKREVLQDIIDMCKAKMGEGVSKRDPTFGGARPGAEHGGSEKDSADVVADKPKAAGTDEEEDDEMEYLKSFGGES